MPTVINYSVKQLDPNNLVSGVVFAVDLLYADGGSNTREATRVDVETFLVEGVYTDSYATPTFVRELALWMVETGRWI